MTRVTQAKDADTYASLQRGIQEEMPIVRDEAATMETAQNLAAAFLKTIPNGWEAPNMRGLGDLLDRCIRGKLEPEYDETAEYVLQAIHFHWGYMELVDEIVMQLDLPMPSEQNMRKLGSNSLERRTSASDSQITTRMLRAIIPSS